MAAWAGRSRSRHLPGVAALSSLIFRKEAQVLGTGKTVLVIGMNGSGLMPTTPRKARILLRDKRAAVVKKKPFTIRLLYKTGCATQDVDFGVDTGSQHIGTAVVSDDTVLQKSEWALRPTMKKRKLLETRKQYRGGRRYRKTPYRKPKFRYHTKRTYTEEQVKRNGCLTHWKKEPICYESRRPKGWLPPSVQSKVDHHIAIISWHKKALPTKTAVRIELARFDIQRIKNPTIHGEEYQRGRMYDYENVKAYILAKYEYTCPICGRKIGSTRPDGSIVKARKHHIDYRSEGATNNPDEYMLICDRCHTAENHKDGAVLGKIRRESKKKRGMRDMTMMNIVAKRLRTAFPDASFTYGNITKADREAIGLPKTHANDAVAIAKHVDIVKDGDCTLHDTSETFVYIQTRKKKRSLHEAKPRRGRKEPNRNAFRDSKNTKAVSVGDVKYALYDKVLVSGQYGWITGFTGKAAYVKDPDGSYIHPGKTYKQVNLSAIRLKNRNNNWVLYVPRRGSSAIHPLPEGRGLLAEIS